MQGMKGITKQDLIEMIEKNFPESYDNDIIATFFYCNNGNNEPQQQCVLFRKELMNN